MPISPEVQAWVDEMKSAGAPNGWIADTLALMAENEGIQKKHREAVLAQSDYTRRMQELAGLKKQEQDELAKTTDWAKRLTAWEGTQKTELDQAKKARKEAEDRLGAINTKIQELKTQGYLDDSLMPANLGASERKTPIATENRTPELTRDEALRFSWNSLTIADQMDELREQHKGLFQGVNDPAKRFSGKKVLDYCNEKNVAPDVAWNQLYGVDVRREELRQVAEDKRVEERAEEKYRKRVSQDIEAGRPVSVATSPSNMQRMSAIPDLKNQNPYQRHHARVQKAVAELESKRNVA
jgi:hypothetical protein